MIIIKIKIELKKINILLSKYIMFYNIFFNQCINILYSELSFATNSVNKLLRVSTVSF